MGKPAARMGDPTVHGGTIVVGFPTVLIGGKPAARIGDMHLCPMVNPGPVPHVGGPITMGSPTVLIGGMPAARMGDMATCVGPPDTIAMGCPTVLIGEGGGGAGAAGATVGANAGSFAVNTQRRRGLFGAIVGGIIGAIVGAVAGVAIGGLPGAIVGGIVGAISGAAAGYALTSREVTTYGNSIVIEGTPEFRQRVVDDLNTIASTPTGKLLLSDIDKSGHTVTIKYSAERYEEVPDNWNDGMLQADGTPGPGTGSTIYYPATDVTLDDGTEPWHTVPSAVGLAHELIHSAHNAYGRSDGNNVPYADLNGQMDIAPGYELQAVGLGPYQGNDYTENKIRDELNLPLRTYY